MQNVLFSFHTWKKDLFPLFQVCKFITKTFSTVTQAGKYMFKVNNRNTRTKCEICSKLTIKTPERRHWQSAKSTWSICIQRWKTSSCPVNNKGRKANTQTHTFFWKWINSRHLPSYWFHEKGFESSENVNIECPIKSNINFNMLWNLRKFGVFKFQYHKKCNQKFTMKRLLLLVLVISRWYVSCFIDFHNLHVLVFLKNTKVLWQLRAVDSECIGYLLFFGITKTYQEWFRGNTSNLFSK